MRLYVIILLGAAVSVAACKNKEQQAGLVPEVSVVIAGQQTVPVYAEYVGQTFGQTDVELYPRIKGWVKGIYFKEGTQIKKGQLLYVIQDDELRDKEQVAQAQLAEQKILMVKTKADLSRVKPLVEMNALSQRELDASQAAYDAQRQAVVAAGAALSNARLQLSYSRILAPISGTIGVSKVQVGDYVKESGQTAINTISATGEMRVRFAIPENDYLAYRQRINKGNSRNLPVEFILNDGTPFPEQGRLDFANREIDPSTGSLLIQTVVRNSSNLLRPGQYLKVRIKSEDIQGAIVVPQQAVNQMQDIYMVYVVNDSNKIKSVPVKVSRRVGSNWIITEGLKQGQKVALVGNAIIKPETQIKPVVITYSYDSTSGIK